MSSSLLNERLQTLVIRADGSATIGGGHIMRCLAVAQLWAERYGKVVFVSAEITTELAFAIANAGHDLKKIDADRGGAEDAKILANYGYHFLANTIVLDGYCFDLDYQKQLRRDAWTLVVYDDHGQRNGFFCDVLINQNIQATSEMYLGKATADTLLMGSDYAALRKEFASSAGTSRNYNKSNEILISLGLGDMTCMINDILAAVKESTVRHTKLHIAATGSDIPEIEKAGQKFNLQLHVKPQFDDIARRLQKSFFSILSASGTAHESACLATPMILVSVADNQLPAYRGFVSKNAALAGGISASFDKRTCTEAIDEIANSEKLRRTLGTNARNAVDGMGASRVVTVLGQYRSTKMESKNGI